MDETGAFSKQLKEWNTVSPATKQVCPGYYNTNINPKYKSTLPKNISNTLVFRVSYILYWFSLCMVRHQLSRLDPNSKLCINSCRNIITIAKCNSIIHLRTYMAMNRLLEKATFESFWPFQMKMIVTVFFRNSTRPSIFTTNGPNSAKL